MIRIAELTHSYQSIWRRAGPVRAIDRLSLDIPGGSAVGLIGVNGAGKTTLIRSLLGYLSPSSGEVEIAGTSPRRYLEHQGVAYVPERVAIPGRWTVEEALRAYALLGRRDDADQERGNKALRRLGLEAIRDRRVAGLSKGNLQRLAIAQAVMGQRSLMILDEPTDGLDPVWIAELRAILEEWRSADPQRTLIVASHNLPLVERIADRVVILHDGRLIADMVPEQGRSMPPLEEAFLRLVRREGAAA